MSRESKGSTWDTLRVEQQAYQAHGSYPDNEAPPATRGKSSRRRLMAFTAIDRVIVVTNLTSCTKTKQILDHSNGASRTTSFLTKTTLPG